MRNFAHPCQILLDSKFLQLHCICRRFRLATTLSKDDLASSVSTNIVTAGPSGTVLLHESDCCLFALCCGCSAQCGKCDFDVNGRLLVLWLTCVLSSLQTFHKSSSLTSAHVVSCFSLSGFHPSNMLFWNRWSWGVSSFSTICSPYVEACEQVMCRVLHVWNDSLSSLKAFVSWWSFLHRIWTM
jgi:hypothetical protein